MTTTTNHTPNTSDAGATLPPGDPRHGLNGYSKRKCRCSVCREANRACSAAYYAANREKESARKAASYAENPEKIRARNKAYEVANPEKTRIRRATYSQRPDARARAAARGKTPEVRAQRSAYAKTPVAKAKAAAWQKTPIARAGQLAYRRTSQALAKQVVANATPSARAAKLAWSESPRGRLIGRAHTAARRSCVNGGTATKADVLAVFAVADGRCCYCLAVVGDELLDLEHVVPLSRGGRHDPDNLAAACRKCNRLTGGKHGKCPVAWIASSGSATPDSPALARYTAALNA